MQIEGRLWLAFEVVEEPQTRGSKTPRANAKIGQTFIPKGLKLWCEDSNPNSKAYMGTIGTHCHNEAIRQGKLPPGILGVQVHPWEGPVILRLTFFLRRPKDHYRTVKGERGPLKESAPVFPGSVDCDKLHRPVQDALSGIAYRDDRQVAKIHSDKEFGEIEGIRIRIYHLPRTIAELREWLKESAV